MTPAWNDPSLNVASDNRWRARHRALQSWYRETVLKVPPGLDKTGKIRGNFLPSAAVRKNPGLNFLAPEIAAYVQSRVPEIQKEHGTLDLDRLRRNMLSSMPLCFNVFGFLRVHPEAAARVLSAVLSLDIKSVEQIEVEWTPPGEHPLGDRTAFDTFVEYRTGSGTRGFLGVETKYTDSFSQREYWTPIYAKITSSPESGFRRGVAGRLRAPHTNQLWRNCLLAVQARSGGRYECGHALVLARAEDTAGRSVVEQVRSKLAHPDQLLRFVSLEEMINAAIVESELEEWAIAFKQRYLDLTPVMGMNGGT